MVSGAYTRPSGDDWLFQMTGWDNVWWWQTTCQTLVVLGGLAAIVAMALGVENYKNTKDLLHNQQVLDVLLANLTDTSDVGLAWQYCDSLVALGDTAAPIDMASMAACIAAGTTF